LAKPIDLRKSLIWAAVLLVVDAFVFNQGAISLLVGIWMLFAALPRALFTREPAVKRLRLARVGIFLVAVALVIVSIRANNQVARSRAETLIAAVKAFKQQKQRYPANLDELVPGFIDRVPAAKYTFWLNSFTYLASPEHHSLSYVGLPPFGRPIYNFERDRWGYLD